MKSSRKNGKETGERSSTRLDNTARGLKALDEAVADAVGSQSAQGKEERQRQVIRDSGGDAGKARKECHHQVAEIVVVDGEARGPGVVGRQGRRLENAVEHHEVHELLGAHKLRRILTQHRIGSQENQEEDFHDVDLMPHGFPYSFSGVSGSAAL